MTEIPFHERMRQELIWPNPASLEIPNEAMKSFNNAMGDWIMGGAHGFCMPRGSGEGHCDPESFVMTIGTRLDELCNAYNGNPTQSPIEDMLLGALFWLDSETAGFPMFDGLGDGPTRGEDGAYSNLPGMTLWITTQAPIKGYKADFLLWFSQGKEAAGIVVECDGHNFHEKTKEQAARDKKRDRELLSAGYPVLRFTGSEIFKDPQECVNQIQSVLLDVAYSMHRQGRF